MTDATAAAAIALIERAGCSWRREEPQPGHIRIQFARRPDFSNSVVLEISRDEVFHLLIDEYLLTEFNYDDGPRSPELEAQVQRGLDYLHGRCREERRQKGAALVSRRLIFPDGADMRLWLPPWQRLRARITGKARPLRSSSHP
jgi:hypothetical protein